MFAALKTLQGRKTILAALLTIAGFWGAYFYGDIPQMEAWKMTSEAVMVIFARLGILAAHRAAESKENTQ